jgi:hypothetical protein
MRNAERASLAPWRNFSAVNGMLIVRLIRTQSWFRL